MSEKINSALKKGLLAIQPDRIGNISKTLSFILLFHIFSFVINAIIYFDQVKCRHVFPEMTNLIV